MRRELLKDISRLVVKLGTGVLTDSRKQPDLAQLEQLVTQVADGKARAIKLKRITSTNGFRSCVRKTCVGARYS